jgi:hypothetical protein
MKVFFDPNRRVAKDVCHSEKEVRHILIGRTKNGRLLFVAFTIRVDKIRIISARDLKKKEKKLYEKAN